MTQYLISFGAHAMDHIPDEDAPAVARAEFTTALFPKGGRCLVPVKVAVQRTEAIGEGAIVEVVLRLNAAPGMTANAVGGISGRWSSSVFTCRYAVAQPA
jgi:hypothetical protein